LNGLKLSPMWAFGKEINPLTHKKPVPFPMFSLTVRLGTKKEKHQHGSSWVPTFEVLKDESGYPVLITDPGKFVYLRDHVRQLEEIMEQVISVNSVEKMSDPVTAFLNAEDSKS